MGEQKTQPWWVPSGATFQLPPRMRLAPAERETLWKGLERFANCGDSLANYKGFGRAFPDFWPVKVWHYPNQTPSTPPPILGSISIDEPELSEEESSRKIAHESQTESLAWDPACHKLFLLYRDTLKQVWSGKQTIKAGGVPWRTDTSACEFLLGLTDYNVEARKSAPGGLHLSLVWPVALGFAWERILSQFPTAVDEGRVRIGMLWKQGDFSLVPNNDFQRAFYLLFRQSWRARVCPRCKIFFVARKPKQVFCGTVCSAGSRLASKRKWWKRVGSKQRAKQQRVISGRRHRRGKRR